MVSLNKNRERFGQDMFISGLKTSDNVVMQQYCITSVTVKFHGRLVYAIAVIFAWLFRMYITNMFVTGSLT